MQLVDDNMVGMFINNNFLGVIVLGAGFGVALTQLTQKSKYEIEGDMCTCFDKDTSTNKHHPFIQFSASWSELG